MIIMGIDPGLAKAGWGIIKAGDDSSISILKYGCISTSNTSSFSERLAVLYNKFIDIIKEYKPEEVAVEELFFAKNSKTAIDVAQARGAIILAMNHSNIRVSEYTPLQIKQAVVGYGRAEKNQVQFMVRSLLKLKQIPKPDHASDALAAAICHSSSRRMKELQ